MSAHVAAIHFAYHTSSIQAWDNTHDALLGPNYTKTDVMAVVIRFIEFYNKERPKKKLGFLSPLQFGLQNPKGTYPIPISK